LIFVERQTLRFCPCSDDEVGQRESDQIHETVPPELEGAETEKYGVDIGIRDGV